MKNKFKYIIIISVIFLTGCESVGNTSIDQILINIQKVINPLLELIVTISFISGIWMIFRGVSMFKQFGATQNQMTKPGELSGPLVYIVIGGILIYLPISTGVITTTIFGQAQSSLFNSRSIDVTKLGEASSTILSYVTAAADDRWETLANVLVYYINLVGFIAFVKGWFILANGAQPGTQPGTIPKGLTHLIGGIIAVNFIPFIKALHTTVFGTA